MTTIAQPTAQVSSNPPSFTTNVFKNVLPTHNNTSAPSQQTITSTQSTNINKLKAVLHINDPSNPKSEQPTEPSFADQFDERCGLTRTQRFIGFGICFSVGWLLNLMSIFAVASIITSPAKFAVMYTVGNLLSLGATLFLWGPIKQIKSMFAPIRVVATCVFLASMITTIGLAYGLKPPKAWPVIITMIIQFCAAVWYVNTVHIYIYIYKH